MKDKNAKPIDELDTPELLALYADVNADQSVKKRRLVLKIINDALTNRGYVFDETVGKWVPRADEDGEGNDG